MYFYGSGRMDRNRIESLTIVVRIVNTSPFFIIRILFIWHFMMMMNINYYSFSLSIQFNLDDCFLCWMNSIPKKKHPNEWILFMVRLSTLRILNSLWITAGIYPSQSSHHQITSQPINQPTTLFECFEKKERKP